jgi:hypothetical protein
LEPFAPEPTDSDLGSPGAPFGWASGALGDSLLGDTMSFSLDDFVAENLPDDNCINRPEDLRKIVRKVFLLAAEWVRDAEGDGVADNLLADFGIER